jgi:hypothetical protein
MNFKFQIAKKITTADNFKYGTVSSFSIQMCMVTHLFEMFEKLFATKTNKLYESTEKSKTFPNSDLLHILCAFQILKVQIQLVFCMLLSFSIFFAFRVSAKLFPS